MVKDRIADSSIDELKKFADLLRDENEDRLEKACSVLKLVSLFDMDLFQHEDPTVVSQLRKDLKANGVKVNEIKSVTEFAKVFAWDSPSTWNDSFADSVSNAFSELKSRCTRDQPEMIKKAKYDELHAVLEKGKKTLGPRILTKAVNKRWRGGSLRDYIRDFGDGIVDEVSYSYVQEVPNQDSRIAFRDRAVTEKTKKAKRLSTRGRKILSQIMTQVRDTHGCNKVYGELNVDNIKLSSNLIAELPKLDRRALKHDPETCHCDCNKIKGIIRSMLGGDSLTLPEDSPEDVKHLYNLLTSARDWFESYHDTVFDHACIWAPSEMVRNVIVMKMIIAEEVGKENKKLQKALVEMNKHVDTDWPVKNLLTDRSPYWTMYKCWKADMWLSRCVDDNKFKEILSRNRGFYVLYYMRNCYPHTREHPEKKLKSSQNKVLNGKKLGRIRKEDQEEESIKVKEVSTKKEEEEEEEEEEEDEEEEEESIKVKSLLQIENDLYVMFPTYMSELLLATAKCQFEFEDLNSRHLKMDYE